jgi:hypothetical protein
LQKYKLNVTITNKKYFLNKFYIASGKKWVQGPDFPKYLSIFAEIVKYKGAWRRKRNCYDIIDDRLRQVRNHFSG